ncbi:MAG: bifunctional [glutamate--ammonia ligase]-adenylyl-L-tyrosine phosphorylase/[glutamate--ammonia-ligase] adenylyltransferase [Hirschia sp.]|nr:bifunctional [glutamate--ammonia ligase]-adenylyl-L-tyrosine phosphorylase/[glutamate--ammonia-ligase] adenylyltransferase [Hirschia sp.]MBF19310.1 bifunctional [glutamate--ammonia ligase]-adenylyl-L-tyrosine phosphorylase/[glutamate--ammonia-ligase] adenylyltransferase [Hirschia sp.]
MTESLLDDLVLPGISDLLTDPKVLDATLSHSPYLNLLVRRFPQTLETANAHGFEAAFALALDKCSQALASPLDRDQVIASLRHAKGLGHLAIGLADLSGEWSVKQVTHAITQLADATCQAALWAAYSRAAEREWVAPREALEQTGLFAIAMGKMGAFELNYSSDVDLIMLFDPDRFEARSRSAKEAAVRITQDFTGIMETRDANGYVFRVDLRLRPDPSSNAVALSTETALNYYESYGQNWERMAHIKARPCAGDLEAGHAYLKELEPFVWRRHLDYWAIGDIHAIKRQIHSHKGMEDLNHAEFDVKLGVGGIREIEFFAQTQQLILGGREPELRVHRTDDALDVLVGMKIVDGAEARDLKRAYDILRAVEHRIQLRNDEQTHKLPEDGTVREAIAALSGYERDLERFDADLFRLRGRVHGIYSDLFGEEERLSGERGNLVFTGVDDDPGTLETIADMGFSEPSRVIETIRRWHRGGLPATRSARGRELLTNLTPRILGWMSEAAEPDAALARFSEFLTGLRSGVQVFALMLAEPAFARDLIVAMAQSPKLAKDLARQPALLDGMLSNQFRAPLSDDDENRVMAELTEAVKAEADFEDQLNAARRLHREEQLRIGYHVLRGRAPADVAGEAYTRLADACINLMAGSALDEVERRFGPWPAKWVVCGLGKLGGRELSATSDLDIMVIYDPGTPPPPDDLAPRFTQRLIAALSSPTEEGALYEVDMRLRPSGMAGPVAVKLTSFKRYYEAEAWTWEFMALTRLRVIAGDAELADRVRQIQCASLATRSSLPELRDDIANMRRRLFKERPPKSIWDVKDAEGGLVDVEFIVQQEMLLKADDMPSLVSANTEVAIDRLHAAQLLSDEEADVLKRGYQLQLNIQQAVRIASETGFDPDASSQGRKTWLAGVLGKASFEVLKDDLIAAQAGIAAVRLQKIGPLATDS